MLASTVQFSTNDQDTTQNPDAHPHTGSSPSDQGPAGHPTAHHPETSPDQHDDHRDPKDQQPRVAVPSGPNSVPGRPHQQQHPFPTRTEARRTQDCHQQDRP